MANKFPSGAWASFMDFWASLVTANKSSPAFLVMAGSSVSLEQENAKELGN